MLVLSRNKNLSSVFYMRAGGEATSNSRTVQKIISFGNLPNGWHYGRGRPASGSMIRVALTALSNLMFLGFFKTDAFPGVDGEIMVTAYVGKHCIEVTCENDNTFVVTHEFKNEDLFNEADRSREQSHADLLSIVEDIKQLDREECAILSLSTLNITTTTIKESLRTWRSRLQAEMNLAHQSSMYNAEPTQLAQSAPISINIIPAWADTRQLSGSLT